MKTIREICNNKVWVAIQHMIDGLEQASKRSDFKIDMTVFGCFDGMPFREDGKTSPGMCFGCAATCAIQSVSGVEFTDDQISCRSSRARVISFDVDDLSDFEHAINDFRRGYISAIWNYIYGTNKDIPQSIRLLTSNLPYLSTQHWKTKIEDYHTLVQHLKDLDI